MIKDDTIGLFINITLHVLILYTFLTILFFTVIINIEEKQIQDQLFPVIDKQVIKLLTKAKAGWDKDYKDLFGPFPWEIVKKIALSGMEKNKNPSEEVINNNVKLRYNSILIILVLFFVLILLIGYFKYIKRRKFGLRYILTQNFFIFLFVGVIEFLFFWNIIQKYTPIYPKEAEITALKRVRKIISEL
tara:strand:+ start:1516 stop:2082 length:567 start_codon:yes stop_codon:yes gene_type:complete